MTISVRPDPIRTDESNAFAHRTMSVRVPAIARDVLAQNPDYDVAIQEAIKALAGELEADAPIRMLDLPAPDYEDWAAQYASFAGDTWQNTQWFFAEVYFYRLLMQAVRWFETGRDPFLPKKREELESDALWTTLGEALEKQALPPDERLGALLQYALWGNRIDLSYALSQSHGGSWSDDDLLIDDHAATVAHLMARRGDVVHIVLDNTGTELATDLALVDGLLTTLDARVVLHTKAHPTFVSDAIVPDVWHLIDAMTARGGAFAASAGRLRAAFAARRLRIMPDAYWNSTRFLWDLPERLTSLFYRPDSALVIFKGDANYRRVVGDALWQAETPLREVVGFFDAPLLLLRTLKSDPVVGLPAGMAEKLQAADPEWRVNGKRGVLHFQK